MAAKIITLTTQRDAGNPIDDVQLVVSVNGLTVEVAAGSFTCRGEALSLPQVASTVIAPDPTKAMDVTGSLAKDRGNSDAIVVVSGAIVVDTPWSPNNWAGGNHEILCNLWRIRVDAAAGSLTEDELVYYQYVPAAPQ